MHKYHIEDIYELEDFNMINMESDNAGIYGKYYSRVDTENYDDIEEININDINKDKKELASKLNLDESLFKIYTGIEVS